MRPLRLEVKNFTAFRDAQEIDFDDLDLLAISGPTGSGKSSLLDAMTYALYGYVERVGKQVGQLVSQGQPRMSVTLEFAVDDERYRVTRSTPVKGNSQVLLERADGDGWVQAGEGADKVSAANELIRRAVGLDYDAFTRTVLLPQGRFAEFLVGDAKERRAILTDLLGLELFERLGRRAGDLKREAEAEVRAKTSVLETEYAGVTPDAVAEAEALAKDAAHRDEAVAEAETKVRGVAERWADAARTIADLQTCERDLRAAASVAETAGEGLVEVAERGERLDEERRERSKAVARLEKAITKATAAREKAEASWGRAVDLAGLRARGASFLEARARLAEAQDELAKAEAAVPTLEAACVTAEERLAAAVARAEAAAEAMTTADTALEDARHADLVAAVRAGVHVGEDCPVCGRKVETLPKRGGAPSLRKAEVAVERAKAVARAGTAAVETGTRERDAAASAAAAARAEVQRCTKAVAKATENVRRLEGELAPAFAGTVPADPIEVIDERLERLEVLEADEDGAERSLAEGREGLAAVEAERARLQAALAEGRGRLESMAVTGLLDRARALAPEVAEAPAPLSGSEDARSLAGLAVSLVEVLEGSASALARMAAERAEDETAVLREAAVHLEGIVDALGATTVAEVVEAAARARTAAAKEAARLEDRAARAREKLANAEAVVEQVVEHRTRADVFGTLAKELRQDRVIAFLQVEALQLLAAAGSERLSALSQGRYRLGYGDDEFSVVDTWNGEERRSARTLSGGETFLASLALALALSEQVRALAVTEKARLDSLFLDEGFGTLDPESLEVVVEAIEQLGGDGRMVGVITHVRELAIRLPARIEVEKSPRGSRLQVVT